MEEVMQQAEGAMQPAVEPATSAETTAVVSEGLNIAVQAGLEAAEAAKEDPGVAEDTQAKIEQGVLMLAEAQEELQMGKAAPGAGVAPEAEPTVA